MCKKSLLFVLLMALFAPWAANAQTTVEIGDGTSASYYAPIGTLYNYSITEQLYTAEEIGMPGIIQSISFNYALTEAKDFPIEVYMKLVDAANLSTGISLADADLVFNGTLSVTGAGWATITLDTPFVYDGTSNLLIGVNKGYVQWFSGSSWYYTEVANMTRYSQQDGSGYTTSTTPGTSTSYRPNIQMEITASSGPFCAKPSGVTVDYTGGTTAQVSWNSDAASFNIDVNGTVTNNVTNPYTLTGLNLATTYTVKVQAVCGGDNGSSDWTNGTSFTTDFCMPENQCNLTFVLTDTYGDSWNGNAIVVKDAATGDILATLANQNLNGTSGSGENETQTVTLAVCDGRELELSWVAGSYTSEVIYTVTDINNEVLVEGSGAGFDTFTFTPNCTPVTCERPLDLAVAYNGGTTAMVTWAGHAESYNIDLNGTVIEGITNTEYELTGLELATAYSVMVQANCGADGLSNWTNAVSFMTDLCMPEDMCQISLALVDSYGDGWNGAAIEVYDFDTITEDLTLLNSFTLESGTSSGNFTLNVCDGRYLVFFWSAGSYDSECSYTVYDNLGDPIFSGSGAMEDYEIFFMNCNSTCRTPIEFTASEISGHSVMLNWTEQGEATSWTLAYMPETDTVVSYIENITTKPYMLEGLTPLTKYYAMVTANCEDQYKWSDVISWTTDAACPKPRITVDPTPNSALVSWTGLADEYEFEWAEVPATGAKDPYNDGNWYYYDNGTYEGSVGLGGGEFHWGVMFPAGTYEGTLVSKVKAYDINAMVGTLAIYNDGETAPANQISIQDVEFTGAGDWVEFTTNAIIDPSKNVWIVFDAVDGAAYPMGTSADDNGDANGRWVEISGTWYDMANVGVEGRANMLRAYIEAGVDPSELHWVPVAGATSPVTLDNLDPETQYAVRIKALCGGEDGESEWATYFFWTPSACATPINLAAEVEATSATLSWSDYQDSYNLKYRYALPADPTAPATIILEAHNVWGEDDDSGYQMLLDADATAYGTIIPQTGGLTTSGDATAETYAEFEYKIPVNADGALTTENIVFDGRVTIEIPAGTYDWCITNPTPGDRMWIASGNGNVNGRQDDFVFEPGVTYEFVVSMHGSNDGVDLTITRPMSDWITVENVNTPYELTGLTPKTAYEWQVQGLNCEGEGHNTDWTEVATFTTLEALTQTIALTAGANWFSTNVEITLDDLKAALVEALPGSNIVIQSKNQNTTYNGSRWRGQLTSMDVASMYKITVQADCEIALTGMPIDPTEHPITIAPNAITWIGFPFATSMSVADAFAGFAVSGDQVNAKTQSTTYNGTRWRGQLTTLEPGKGYTYNSSSSEERTLVYYAPSKAKSIVKPMMPQDPNAVKRIESKTSDNQILEAPRKSAKESIIERFKKLNNYYKKLININK